VSLSPQHPVFGALPPWLDAPVRMALKDLQHPTPVELRLGYSAAQSGGTLWVQERGEEAWLGVWLPGHERSSTLVVRIADELQEQFFPESKGAWGEPRPPCPGHEHPATAREHGDEAWWTCPGDHRRLARIGELVGG
jgi:hypothetical protein